jgi:hypothetical protein
MTAHVKPDFVVPFIEKHGEGSGCKNFPLFFTVCHIISEDDPKFVGVDCKT